MRLAARWAAVIVAALSQAVHAADPYPAKPVQIITVFAPGTGPDARLRSWAVLLEKHLGQRVIIDSQTSAGGAVAAQNVARAQPDGYTVLSHVGSFLAAKILQPALSFDPIADFAPILSYGASPMVMLVRADGGAAKVEDLIARLKAAPGKLNYASPGVASPAHLAAAVFLSVARLDAVHIPYSSAAEMNRALLRGDVDFSIPGYTVGAPLIETGKIRALAVLAAARMKSMPEVPTLHELYRNDLVVQESWGGIWGPAKMPQAIVKRLHGDIVKAMTELEPTRDPRDREVPLTLSASPEEFAAYVRQESVKWREIIRVAGVKGE